MNLNKDEVNKFLDDEEYETVEKFQYNSDRNQKKKHKKSRRQKPEWKKYRDDAY